MIKGRAGIYMNPETVADTLVTNPRRETHFIKGGNMNIYVGNLPLEVTEDELRQEFTAFGEVLSTIIMNDKYIGSGQQRGYGFVQMPSQSEGKAAITALNDKTLGHMTISVVEALPLSDKKGNGSSVVRRGSWPVSRVRRSRVRQRRYKIS
jgi:RNA recognition motif-containing protein